MGAVWMRVRSDLRSSWWGFIGLVALVGLVGGVVLTAASGARRTETAFPRLLAETNASDALISPFASDAAPFAAVVARQREVRSIATAAACFGIIRHTPGGGTPDLATTRVYNAIAGIDGRYLRSIDRPKLIAGTLPDPSRVDHALLNRFMATELGLTAGDRIALDVIVGGGDEAPQLVPITFTITGVAIFAEDVIPSAVLSSEPTLYGTRAFARTYRHASDCGGIVVRLKSGASLNAFRDKIVTLAHNNPQMTGGQIFFSDAHARNAKVVRAVRPQALALWLFALLAGIASLGIVGQILARRVSLASVDHPALRAMGMSRGRLFAVEMTRAGLVCIAGACVAAAITIVASPLTPIGPARLAEPHPGFEMNAVVGGLGALGLAAALLAVVALPAWRAARVRAERDDMTRRSRIARAAADSPLPPSAAIGVSMALEPGSGRSAVPVRTALTGASIAVASVVAAIVFAASLSNLIFTPSLFGWTWDAIFDTSFGAVPSELIEKVATIPGVAAVSGGHYGDVTIGGRGIPAVGLEPLMGSVFPRLVAGRPPRSPTEIVLGTKVAARLGLGLDDRVSVTSSAFRPSPPSDEGPPDDEPDPVRAMRVVGIGVFPSLGRGSFDPTGLGEGAALTGAAMPGEGGTDFYAFLLVNYASGADAGAIERSAESTIREHPDCAQNPCELGTEPQQPADITNYARVRGTPLALAGALGLLAVAMLAHTLGTAVRRRRRDLAVLKTLGFVRGQVSTLVVWQASTVAIVSAVVGVPLGIAAGRWAWRAFANQLGVPSPSVAPLLAVGIVVPAAILVANLLAALPARAAGRTRPAVVLRSE